MPLKVCDICHVGNIADMENGMNKQTTPSDRSPAVPLPFTREQFRLDILNIVLFEMRKLRQLVSSDIRFPGFNSPNFNASTSQDAGFSPSGIDNRLISHYVFWDAAVTPLEIGLTYESVKDFAFILALEDHFDYGLYAVTGMRSEESMAYDTIHTWVGAYLTDLSRSKFADEWNGEGHEGLLDGIKRCLFVSELANARLVLEGDEPFYYFSGVAKDDDVSQFGELSIRQLAMLSAMEEMSLRSYISRQTVPKLIINKSDRRTFIVPEVAKEWLIAKGRYLPVKRGRTTSDLDLSFTHFEDTSQFFAMLRERQAFIREKTVDIESFDVELAETLNACNVNDFFGLKHEHLDSEVLLSKLSRLLNLPYNLLAIRAKEAAVKTEIRERQSWLKQLQEMEANFKAVPETGQTIKE